MVGFGFFNDRLSIWFVFVALLKAICNCVIILVQNKFSGGNSQSMQPFDLNNHNRMISYCNSVTILIYLTLLQLVKEWFNTETK